MAVRNPFADGTLNKIPSIKNSLAQENFQYNTGLGDIDRKNQIGAVNTDIASRSKDILKQQGMNNTIDARNAVGSVATASTPATAPAVVNPVTARANSLALGGVNTTVGDSVRNQATNWVNNPNLGFNYEKYNKSALEALGNDQAKAFEAARQSTADTSGSGASLSNLSALALQNALDRNKAGATLDYQANKDKLSNMGQALAAGGQAQQLENSTFGQNLAGLSSATNIDAAQRQIANLEKSTDYQNLMQTFASMGGMDNPEAVRMVNEQLPRINSALYGGTQFSVMTPEEKVRKDAEAGMSTFAYNQASNSPYITIDPATGNRKLTPAGEEAYARQFNSGVGVNPNAIPESPVETKLKSVGADIYANKTPNAISWSSPSGIYTYAANGSYNLVPGFEGNIKSMTTTNIKDYIEKLDAGAFGALGTEAKAALMRAFQSEMDNRNNILTKIGNDPEAMAAVSKMFS